MHAPLPAHPDQHASAAGHLWSVREAAVDRPDCAPRHLLRIERQLAVHLAALRAAAREGREAAAEALARELDPGAQFVSALLAMEAGDHALLDGLVCLAREDPLLQTGLLGALAWTGPRTVQLLLRPWLAGDGFSRCLALAACSQQRRAPGVPLERLVEDPEPAVRGRALRLAGELGATALAPAAAAAAGEAEGPAGYWGAWAAALLGEPAAALPALEAAAEANPAGEAVELAVRAAQPGNARAWLRGLGDDPARLRLVLRGLGALGDPAAAPWLLGRMSDPVLARLAGESFALLTGVDLAHDGLAADPPMAEHEDDPDTGLPWPDPELAGEWWERNARRLPAGTRHLLGLTVDEWACESAWSRGWQRQRRAAAYELALMRPGTGLRDWRARLLPRGGRRVS